MHLALLIFFSTWRYQKAEILRNRASRLKNFLVAHSQIQAISWFFLTKYFIFRLSDLITEKVEAKDWWESCVTWGEKRVYFLITQHKKPASFQFLMVQRVSFQQIMKWQIGFILADRNTKFKMLQFPKAIRRHEVTSTSPKLENLAF